MKITEIFRLDGAAWSVTIDGNSMIVFLPSRDFINALAVGSVVPNCFGRLSVVADIRYSGTRQKDGAHFVGFTTPLGDNGSISTSLTENELLRSALLPYTSAELDALETAIRGAQ